MTRPLNFGCGSTHHPDWVNLDASAADPDVHRLGHTSRISLCGGEFDTVYGSHVLEHLAPAEAARLLRECCRVLKPGGILRLAVPDLEVIARLYLESLH